MKRILSLFLSVSFLLAAFALPGTAYAATTTSGACGPSATWTFDSTTGVLKIEGSGAVTGSADWPSGIVRVEAGDQITSIADNTFESKSDLIEADLPGVTVICRRAFDSCKNLKKVDAPKVLQIQGLGSYSEDGAPGYSGGAFNDCSALQEVNLPSVTSIGQCAFRNCTALQKVNLPSVTSIDRCAFYGCSALQKVCVPCITTLDVLVFANCKALQTMELLNVTEISRWAFRNCEALQQVVAPNLQSFGDAFVNCPALQELDISNYSGEVQSFQTLKNTPSLETIRIAQDNAKYAVQDGIVLTKDLQSIVRMPPKNPLKNIDLPLVTRLEARAFADCTNLETISLPSVTQLEAQAFADCTNLKTISLPNVTYIGNEAFNSCARLKEVRISDRGPQLTIGAKAFNKCRRLTGLLVDGSYENLWPKLQVDETAMDPLTHVRLMFPVTYDANGGTDAPAAERKVLGDDLTLTTREPRRSGYVFAGWSTTANGTVNYQPGDRYTADESATLYAVWQKAAENYTLHYSTDQGVPVPASQTAAGGTQVKLSTVVPRKSGYVFLGWADRQGGTPAYRAGDTYTLQQNTTLYAVWRAQEPAPEVHVYRTKVQPATWSADGRSYEVCDQCGAVRNTRVIAKAKTASLSAVNYTYDGKTKQPTVTVKNSKGKTLKRGTDYTVSYSSGSKNVGRYTVKVTLKGNYSGSKSLTYNINPKGTSVSKVTAAKKGFKVTWKKQATQTTGYQVQYSTSSKFKSAKTVTISKNKTTSKSVGKLSAKKKYYVRVRTYKTVKVNGKNVKLYSGWSKAKSVTTKK